MPKFSVIIPIYNVEKYLCKCIDSVLDQAFTDFEVILVDDGSPDRCPEICDVYSKKDSRVRVIHKENGGVSSARRDGVSIATGEYLVFIDGDDRVTEDFFEVISEHSDVDIIRFGCIVERIGGVMQNRFPKEREGLYRKSDIAKEIFPYLIQSKSASYYCPSLWRHVFKRELYVLNMVSDVNIKIGEDGACVIPCIYHAKSMYCAHKCIYIYNYNETSATKGKNVFPIDGPALIAEHLKAHMDMSDCDFKQQLDRKIVHELFLVVTSQFNGSFSYKETVNNIRQELKLPLYQEAIRSASFPESLKAEIMKITLQYELFFLIYFMGRSKK